MSAISSDEIISILKEEIKNYDVISRDQEVGTVISVGDGIASVYGIDHAMYGEIVTLETGLKGMVQDIKENEISCILFGDDSEIKQGTKVCRTGKKAGIPVGDAYLGRIINALGAPIDGKGEIKADDYRAIEQEAPGIVDRQSVKQPMETGILAINRGEKEGILQVKIEPDMQKIASYLARKIITRKNPNTTKALFAAIEDSYKRLIAPSIERDIRNELTENASTEAIKVFGKNLAQLLMQPPITGQVVLGWDPAFRTGCKLAVVDATGKVLDTVVIYPTAPQNKVEEAKKVVKALIKKYGITLISIGNGTASRESEQIVVDMLKEIKEPVQYVITNEAGASVYSASKLATEEFPNFDVGQRSATSIARRVQDPLAELVKIEPKAIGVGQYQHDMNQKQLTEALGGVVEATVNKVGVDLNTASASLLEYVSGVSKTVAKNIVAYREENGTFRNRKQLLKVAKLGPKAFEQCAGFLRVSGGDEPLDATGVHPETYKETGMLLKNLGYSTKELSKEGFKGISSKITDYKKLSEELGIGEITLKDIVKELEKPGRDPREDLPKPILRTDVLEMKDLKPGMKLKGTVRNVIDFGAFVDIGVHQDGLVHISQMADRFIKHPLEVVSVGDVVDVVVVSVDIDKKRIQLSMKN